MFIFSREREKECAGRYLHNAANLPLIHSVIDTAYDLADGTITPAAAHDVLQDALTNGGGGVWEQSGSWLAKLCPTFPDLDAIWLTLARSSKATIRFRAAAHICDMSPMALDAVLPVLLTDRSAKVRNKVVGDLWVSPRPDAADHLRQRLPNESDDSIADQIREALSKIEALGT